mmetsp:Transcript_3666/g.11504  ORF Transcript_3666/g.11504 Transcript_3666/m.11504 type:complete len:866 (+) Transcript_3666:2-2599(+)
MPRARSESPTNMGRLSVPQLQSSLTDGPCFATWHGSSQRGTGPTPTHAQTSIRAALQGVARSWKQGQLGSTKANIPPLGSPGGSVGSPADGRTKGGSCSTAIMQDFRRWLHEHFPTVEDAFAALIKEQPNPHGFAKREWRRMLSKHPLGPRPVEECDMLFEQLDFRCLGMVTANEFVIGVEGGAPVRTLEDLRRRWLASGFTAMSQAIRRMDENGARSSQRLTFQEFSGLLSSVNVVDPGEHLALFNIVCSDPQGTTSVGELASAVATVSPALLLEDVRDRLLKKYGGNLEKAFFDLDMNRCDRISRQEFVVKAVRTLGFSDVEARKAFKEMDVDSSGGISRWEFLSVIGLSEPSLLLEELRLKIRRRFRRIEAAFARAFDESTTDDVDSQPQLTLEQFEALLRPLDLKETETRVLFHLIDRDHNGELSVPEFVKGVRQFAPSCALEDLRAACCQRYGHVREAFAVAPEPRTKPLDFEAFGRALRKLGLLEPPEPPEAPAVGPARRMRVVHRPGVRLQEVFDLLDVRHDGRASLARLVAALQACGASATVWLPAEELDLRARQDVRGDMAPVHRLIGSLKGQVRQGLHAEDEPAAEARAGAKGPRPCWNRYSSQVTDLLIEASGSPPEGMKRFLQTSMSSGSLGRKRRTAALGTSPSSRTSTKQSRPCTVPSKAASPLAGARARAETSPPALGAAAVSSPGARRRCDRSPSALPSPGALQASAGRTQEEPGAGAGDGDSPLAGSHGVGLVAEMQVKAEQLPGGAPDTQIPRIPHRRPDVRRPSQAAVSSAQQSWGKVWKSLHMTPGQQQRAKLERNVQNYFQSATTSLSQDISLLQGESFSRSATHKHVCACREALKPSSRRIST